jgi:fucose 4-O-acetylase-like acetyltransferase
MVTQTFPPQRTNTTDTLPPGRPEVVRTTQRDAFFDNAKYLAIVLVAMGHSWDLLKGDSRTTEGLYLFVYAFHMPAFVIISGHFSRNFDLRPDRVKRLIAGVVVPYLVFQTVYSLFDLAAGDAPNPPFSLIDPLYLTWFLLALFIWRLTTPLWRVVRHPLTLALVIAALASASPGMGGALDLQRVLQFLPFFVLGLRLRPEHFHVMRMREIRILSVPVVLAALALAYWAAGAGLDTGWLYHDSGARQNGEPWWAGPVVTAGLFGVSVLLTACFLAWVPHRRMWFTALGAGTLYGYLLHGLLIKGVGYAGWFHTYGWLHSAPGEVAVTVVAAAVVTALCTAPVRRVFRWAVEPGMGWAFRAESRKVSPGTL